LVSVTRARTRLTVISEHLSQFAVNARGMMIALYNGAQRCVIKIKSVAQRIDSVWHFMLQSEVIHRTVLTAG